MTDEELAKRVGEANGQLHKAMRDAEAAGLRVDVETLPYHSIELHHESTAIEIQVYREISTD